MTQSLRVLSIEDDPVDAYLISSAFRRWGGGHLELVAARSLGEGLALLARAEPSVVLLDLSLPDALDTEGVKALRRAAPDLPVIVFSGTDDEQLALRALQAGAADYLLKNRLEPSQLACMVTAAVERHRLTRALAAAQRAELERRDAFLSHVSHELRTPLSVIEQFTSILADGLAGPLSDEQAECTDVLARNAKQLRRMVADLLEVSRVQGGQLRVERRAVLLDEVVDQTVAGLLPLAHQREHTVEVHVEPGLEVHADPQRLGQVLSNLFENAIKFTPTGGRLSVIGRPSPHGDDQVQLTVADTGCGIDKDELATIFERFAQGRRGQGDSSRAGLGLGLHISRQIMEAHDGWLWAESRHGQGSRFHLTLPRWSLETLLQPLLARQHGYDEPLVEVRARLAGGRPQASDRELLDQLVAQAAAEVDGVVLPARDGQRRLVARAAGPTLRGLVQRLRQRHARQAREGAGVLRVERHVLHAPRQDGPAPGAARLARRLARDGAAGEPPGEGPSPAADGFSAARPGA